MIISQRVFRPDWRKDTFVHCTSTRCFPLGFVIILSLRNVCHGNCLFLANKLILGLQSIPGHAVTMRQPCWWNSSNMAAMKPGYSRHVRHCYFTIRSGNGHFVLIGQSCNPLLAGESKNSLIELRNPQPIHSDSLSIYDAGKFAELVLFNYER